MMNYTERILSNVEMSEHNKKSKLSSSCRVCAIEGAQIHYGGICCVSCKMFFRRNAQFDLVS